MDSIYLPLQLFTVCTLIHSYYTWIHHREFQLLGFFQGAAIWTTIDEQRPGHSGRLFKNLQPSSKRSEGYGQNPILTST